MLFVDAVKLAEHASFQKRPKSFNRVGMDISVHMPVRVLDNDMRENLVHPVVGCVLIGDEASRHNVDALLDKSPQVLALHLALIDGAGRDVAAALDGPDDRGLFSAAPALGLIIIVVFLALARLPADVALVH